MLLNMLVPGVAGLPNMPPPIDVVDGLVKRDPEAFVLGPNIPGEGGC